MKKKIENSDNLPVDEFPEIFENVSSKKKKKIKRIPQKDLLLY